MEDYLKRAYAAYFRSGGYDQPASLSSGTCKVGGKEYVVLKNINGLLAVYRITTAGQLKRLKRWPKEFED